MTETACGLFQWECLNWTEKAVWNRQSSDQIAVVERFLNRDRCLWTGRGGAGGLVHGKPNRWVMEWAKGAREKRVSVMNVCSCSRRPRKSPHLKIRAARVGSPRWPGCSAQWAPVHYLGNARDDIGVFAGVVFLVAAEYSHLATLQNVNLWKQMTNNKDTV